MMNVGIFFSQFLTEVLKDDAEVQTDLLFENFFSFYVILRLRNLRLDRDMTWDHLSRLLYHILRLFLDQTVLFFCLCLSKKA